MGTSLTKYNKLKYLFKKKSKKNKIGANGESWWEARRVKPSLSMHERQKLLFFSPN